MLQQWITQITIVQSSDEDVVRRGRISIIIFLGALIFPLLLVPITIVKGDDIPLVGLIALSINSVLNLLYLYLSRRGAVSISSLIFLGTSIMLTCGSIVSAQEYGAISLFLIPPVVAAGLLLRPWQIWIVVALCVAGLFGIVMLLPTAVTSVLAVQIMIVITIVIILNVGLLEFLGARAMAAALAQARARRSEAEASAALLAETNVMLVQAQAADLQRQNAEQQQLLELVAELETPTITVAEGVLLAPIIGRMSAQRSAALQQRLLDVAYTQRPQRVILDLTGLSDVDDGSVRALLAIIQALRLLGCAVTVTGVSAAAALALTQQAVQLSGVTVARSPEDALASVYTRARMN